MEKYDCVRDSFVFMASDLDFTLRENEEHLVHIAIAHGIKIKRTDFPFDIF